MAVLACGGAFLDLRTESCQLQGHRVMRYGLMPVPLCLGHIDYRRGYEISSGQREQSSTNDCICDSLFSSGLKELGVE